MPGESDLPQFGRPSFPELSPAPSRDGNILELSFGKLDTSLGWLFDSVDILSKGLTQVNKNIGASSDDLAKRIHDLENRPPPESVTIVQERAKTPPPRPKTPPPPVEIPYVPDEAERAREAKKAVQPLIDDEVGKLNAKIEPLAPRLQTLEEFAGRTSPWDRMQTYMQEIGFLPYGEPEEKDPVVLLGQCLVLLRQDISMCPRIKDLEDVKDTLNARIGQVESDAAADREHRSQLAAAESAKIAEDLSRVDHLVEGLVQKNVEDGDVAGGLRDLALRVDGHEERRFPKLEMRVRFLEEAGPSGGSGEDGAPKKKGLLEMLAEVDLAEEVRRLRTMVECMESAMPYETRQTMQFFRESGQGGEASPNTHDGGDPMDRLAAMSGDVGAPSSKAGANSNLDLANFRSETERQLEQFRQKNERETQNMVRNLKNHEKKVDQLESKILDMWNRMPKVLAVLEPLQAQLEMFMNTDPEDALIDNTGGAYKPLPSLMDGGTGGGGSAPVPGDSAPGVSTTFFTEPSMEGSEVATAAPIASEGGLGVTNAIAGGTGTQPASSVPELGLSQERVVGEDVVAAGGTTEAVAGAPQVVGNRETSVAETPSATQSGQSRPQAVSSPGQGTIGVAGSGTQAAPIVPTSSGGTQPQAKSNPGPGAARPGAQTAARAMPVPSPNQSRANFMKGGFAPMPEGAAGTGEGGGTMGLSKGKNFSPMAQMGSLTGLIRVALQSTTNEIEFNLRQEMYDVRAQLLGGLEGKANKSELLALASQLDAWSQKSRTRDRFHHTPKDRERSPSPRSEMAETTRELKHSASTPGKLFSSSAATSSSKPFSSTAATSLSQSGKKCGVHERCKEPTCPRAMQMSQSLSRLPALKV